MDPTDVLRKQVSKHLCGKYNLPAIVLSHGKSVTVICCCRQFENELRNEIAQSPEQEIKDMRVTFLSGNIEFV